MSDQLITYIANMQEQEALALTKERLESGVPPMEILDDCRAAMEVVGERFENQEYFIPELILAGEILKAITAEVKPYLETEGEVDETIPVVVGTVRGDIHDIGKDIVVFMLDINGFEVHDLGVDVPPEAFVDRISETEASVVALSGFLTLAFDSMKETVEAIEAAGLRERVKIMVGGGAVDEGVSEYAAADAYGADAMAAVSLAKQWTGGNGRG
jgi:5-methyltetrahydrofolate--homocysteine methyltransferase